MLLLTDSWRAQFCQERVCQYCSWRSDARVVCKGCQVRLQLD